MISSVETGIGDLGGFGVGEAAGLSSTEPQLNIRSSSRNKWGPATFTPPAAPQPTASTAASVPSGYPSESVGYWSLGKKAFHTALHSFYDSK